MTIWERRKQGTKKKKVMMAALLMGLALGVGCASPSGEPPPATEDLVGDDPVVQTFDERGELLSITTHDAENLRSELILADSRELLGVLTWRQSEGIMRMWFASGSEYDFPQEEIDPDYAPGALAMQFEWDAMRTYGSLEATGISETHALKGDGEDSQGCDSVAGILTCTVKGACCDSHDECIRDHDCGGVLDGDGYIGDGFVNTIECTSCQTRVVQCITSPFNYPGESQCCDEGTCGEPQPWNET